jgi:transposase
MRQTHAGGDKLFVDYAGDTVPVMSTPIVERWLLGRLRHRRFYSLAELNAAIGELLRQLNEERRHLAYGGRAACRSRSITVR